MQLFIYLTPPFGYNNPSRRRATDPSLQVKKMKLSQQQIKALAAEVLADVEKKKLLKLNVTPEAALEHIEKGVTDDLMVEDRLNDEVKDLLKAYEKEIAQGKADYKTMFDLVKKKLVRERGIVL